MDLPTGNLTVSTIDELETIFKNDERFLSLRDGNQSSGGGAAGGTNGGGAAKPMPRTEWDALAPAERSKFAGSGGKVI